jgi:uncharacterized membrane protein YgdD (TMEM256/DUF423 family)
MLTADRSVHRRASWLAACGAWLASAAVALSAYAAHALHAAPADAQSRLQTAAVFAFGHGVALAALAPAATRRIGGAALGVLLLRVLLFAGSLVAAQFFSTPTTLAPFGGMLLIVGWLLWGIDALRR